MLGVLAVVFSFGILVMSVVVGKKGKRSPIKDTAYECGMLPIGRSRTQVHFRYYLFAILFLIFDIEAVFLFPWAVAFVKIGAQAFWEMVVFILILAFGLLYAWKKGVLSWGKET